MKSSMLVSVLLGVILSSSPSLVLAYNENTCCELAKKQNAFVGVVPAPEDQKCGQNYSQGLPAANPLYVDYRFCRSECPGIELSKATSPSQWAAPIVQFILPSVIFSMTVPRRKSIDFGYLLDFKLSKTKSAWVDLAIERAVYLALFVFILIPIIIDTLIWIFLIMVGAGNMIVSGLLEAHLDYRLVKYCKDKQSNDANDSMTKRELLTTIVAGNLQLQSGHGDPQQTIPRGLLADTDTDPLVGEEKSKSRLLNLLDAQSNFGGAVGSAVLFFLGPFIYTILDLKTNPSSEDAAISLAFGIEWMNIVNVAIISGCLLASNNPSTSAGIVGAKHEALESHLQPIQRRSTIQAISWPHDSQTVPPHKRTRKDYLHYLLGWSNTYETEFQPVSLWSRGTNKMKWIQQSEAWKADEEFRNAIRITFWGWLFKIFAPAIFLVAVPPASGAVVAYYFPPRGVGCRSLSFISYGACQALISAIAVLRTASKIKGGPPEPGWSTRFLYVVLWFISFFAAVGGTTLQVVGVFRNCFCASLVDSWINIKRKNPYLNLATDTQAARNASYYWILMGYIATAFVGTVTYVAWWYQKIVRHRFTEAVRNLHTQNTPERPRVALTKRRDSSMELLLNADVRSPDEDAAHFMDLGGLRSPTGLPSRRPSSRSHWSWTSTEYPVGTSDRREGGIELSPLG